MSYHPEIGEWVEAEWVLGRTHPARVVEIHEDTPANLDWDGPAYLLEYVRDGETVGTRYYREAKQIKAYDPLPEPVEVGSQWREASASMDDDVFEIKRVTVLEDGEVYLTLTLPRDSDATTSVDLDTFIERVVKGEIEHAATTHQLER